MDKQVHDSYKRLNDTIAKCQKTPDSSSCEFVAIWQDSFDSAVEERGAYEEKTDFWSHATFLMPIFSLFLFYSLRWVITGKVKPLVIRE